MSKKTIALISAFPPGKNSLNEYGYHLAINFAANDDVERVIVLADALNSAETELELDPKVEVQRIWRFNSLFSMVKLLKALWRIKPDLALFNVQMASFGDRELPAALGLITPALARFFGIKSGILAHNMISAIDLEDTLLKGQKLRQLLVKTGGTAIAWAMMKANYVTFTLQSYYDEYFNKFPKAMLYHIGHGTFDTEERDIPPYKDRENILVTMGKFGTYKRLETLLEAVEIARRKIPDLKLIIGGTDHPNCQGYMQSLEKANAGKAHIRFHGYIAEEDIPGFFEQARVSVFDYSSTTGSSGVLHQTVSYGAVPVFPAIGDFVDVSKSEGIIGENYPPNNAKEMAKAILRVLENEPHAETLSKGNLKAAKEMPFSEIIEFHLGQIGER